MLSSSDNQRHALSAERVDSGALHNNEDVIPSTVRHHSTGSIRVLRKQPQPQQQVYVGRRVPPSVGARTVRASGVAPYNNRKAEDERDAFSTSSSDHSMQVRVTINPLIRCPPARQPLPQAVQRDRVKSVSVGSSTVATAIRGNSNDDDHKMNSHSNNDNDSALPWVLSEASPAALLTVTSSGASGKELQGKPGPPPTSVSELVVEDILPFTRPPSTVEEALHEKIDKANDAMHTLPFSPKIDSVEVEKVCPDEHGSTCEERTWRPGKPLRVAYVTWNMAGRSANVQQLSSSCIHPNAHIIIIATQENGPYIGTNSSQRAFEKIVTRDCLKDQYIKIAFKRLWACHMMVLARKRDVAFYVSHVHTSKVPCGLLGFGGNKGAIGVAFSICVRQGEKVYHCSASTGDGSEGSEHTPKKRVDDDKQQQRSNSYSKHTASPIPSPPLCNSFMAGADEVAPPSPERDRGVGSPRSNAEIRAAAPHNSTEPLDVVAADKRLTTSAEDMVALDPPQCSSPFLTAAAAAHAPSIVVPPPCVTPTEDTCSEEVVGGGYSPQQYGMEDSEQTDGGLDTLSSVSVDTPLVTILCINAHFPAHQQAILERNECYHKIIERLKVGRKGKFKKYPWRVSTKAHAASITALSSRGSTPAQGSPAPAPPSPSPSSMSVTREDKPSEQESQTRNATDDFDITFFGGDLNYRINGTKAAIERIAKTRYYRSVLSANDQLNAEMRRGTVFNGFSEGKLEFRPTYKYQIKKAGSPSGVASDYQDRSDEKARMPAYCDRVLYKVNKQSRVERVHVHTYTDVQQVNTSDHRPVVALMDIYTKPLIFRADSSTKTG